MERELVEKEKKIINEERDTSYITNEERKDN